MAATFKQVKALNKELTERFETTAKEPNEGGLIRSYLRCKNSEKEKLEYEKTFEKLFELSKDLETKLNLGVGGEKGDKTIQILDEIRKNMTNIGARLHKVENGKASSVQRACKVSGGDDEGSGEGSAQRRVVSTGPETRWAKGGGRSDDEVEFTKMASLFTGLRPKGRRKNIFSRKCFLGPNPTSISRGTN